MSSKLHGLVQTEWGWLIAIYLFLAGAGAGAYVTGVVLDFMGPEWATIAKIGVFFGFPSVLIGTLFLLADLGKVQNAWRVATKPGTSWIARGTIIISVFLIVSFIHLVFWIFPFSGLENADGLRHLLGIVGLIFGIGTMVYTGLLLGDAIPIPFWSTVLLPILFFVSALSTGIMATILGSSLLFQDSDLVHGLARFDILLLVMEIVILSAFLHGAHRLPSSQHSAKEVLFGGLSRFFWMGVALCGILIPLLIDAIFHNNFMAIVAALFGLAGGLILRYVVLKAGAMPPMDAAGFSFRPVSKPKLPMAARGMVPPGNL